METEVVSNLSYVNGDLDEFISYMNQHHLSQRRGAMIATVNPEIGYATMKDHAYHKVISSADYVLPDGVGVVLMSRLINHPLKSRIAGFEVFMSMLDLANKQSKSIFYMGRKKKCSRLSNSELIRNIQMW